MNISVKMTGQFLDKMKSLPKERIRILQDGLQDASIHLLQKSIQNAPTSTGALRQSMTMDVDRGELRAEIYPTVKYGFFVHGPIDGGAATKPHWIPSIEANPGGSLYRWAQKKGLNPWAVRVGISRKGTKYQPWLKKTADEEDKKVIDIIEKTMNNIAEFLAD